MMRAQLVFLEQHLGALRALLFDRPGTEGAAFVLCGESRGASVTKLLSHAIVPIAEEDILRREWDSLSIHSRALMRITKLAKFDGLSIVFAHSHPQGPADFSLQDDREETKLLPFLQTRVAERIHGTCVLTPNAIVARLYTPECIPAERVMVVGSRLRMHASSHDAAIPEIFDRQVRAFGEDIQRVLGRLHIGIVGLGGTGSPLAEQLYRLGVGHISLFDGDELALSNLNRVYGSSMRDAGTNKTIIAETHLDRIGFGTPIEPYGEPITFEDVARRLRECDLIFGCTDKELPRAILTQLALRYHLPVFDLGVVIDSHAGQIRGIFGRVTTLLPGEACLFCRGRISPEQIRVESLSHEAREAQAREGYAPELEEPAPAVIPFTSSIASAGVMELLHRLTGFMGSERQSSEVLHAFDASRVRTNRVSPREDCFCSDPANWGRGDENPLLGMMWPHRAPS